MNVYSEKTLRESRRQRRVRAATSVATFFASLFPALLFASLGLAFMGLEEAARAAACAAFFTLGAGLALAVPLLVYCDTKGDR